ncbi:MAG TPA: NPCBM/NEW2 domain-containing protein [Pirellulaceae bacterium]|nr:NPCBM/NEW2 domain-containing protein [Pirellulaceae bacterium]
MRTLALVVWLVAVSTTAAQSHAILADGKRLPAALVGIDAELKISLRETEVIRVLPVADLVLWGAYRDVERGPQTILADGSLIVGDVLDIGAQEITIGDATGLGRVLWHPSPLPRSAVRGIIYQPPVDALARDKLLSDVRQFSGREDELRLVGGEVIRGTLQGGEPKPLGPEPPGAERDDFRLAIRGRSEPLVVNAARVQAILLGSSAGSNAAEETVVTLGLADGSLVACRGLKIGKSSVELALAGGGILRAMHEAEADDEGGFWNEVTLVQSHTPRVKYVSELETIGYKHIPFTAIEWPYGRDQNVLGGRLRSGGAVYLYGLGMHSASRLAYDVPAGWKRLEADVALDDAAGLGGSVVFKVVVEDSGQWRAAYQSPIVRGGDAPLPVKVDLKGIARVALLVEYADGGDVLDYANWLNTRLAK